MNCTLRGLICFGMASFYFTIAGHCQSHDPTADSVLYPTRGNPTSAIASKDGRYVFVSVTNVDQPNFSGPDSTAGRRKDAVSGVQVFRRNRPASQIEGLTSVAFVRTGSTGANGLVLLHGGQTLAVGVGDEGVAFLDVHHLIHGKGAPRFAHQTEGAGTFDVVATPDGKFVFSSNEYGVVDGQRGSVGVIATHIDRRERVENPQTISQIPAGDVVPSLSISPDGRRLYVASELIPAHGTPSIAGAGNPSLSKNNCVQRRDAPARPNGYISVVDTEEAIALSKDAVITRVASGCSPVRLTETADASALFVSARGDDAILVFDPHRLESDPEHAFLRSIPSGGTAPVGIRLFSNDHLLGVANSNRFANGGGNLTILDLGGANPRVLPAGEFPRNLSLSADGSTLFLTNYTSRSLQVVRIGK
jgi:hypothetical protein